MSSDRFVVMGLGRSRAEWFSSVSLWVNSGTIPVEFVKCLSAGEVKHRLSGTQPYSALIVEAGIAGLDRDLIETGNRLGIATLVIDRATDRSRQWLELGAAAVLNPEISPVELMSSLNLHARPISNDDEIVEYEHEATTATNNLIAVCGAGGTGTSTMAIALAQGFADDVLQNDLVLLADLARNGEQAMLHDTSDIVPGIEDLVDTHRKSRATSEDIRALTFSVPSRGYRLLLGQRRPYAWTGMPTRAVSESINGMCRTFKTVVCDITADFEGEDNGGSVDVEERNALPRLAAINAQVVVAVGSASMKGVHSLSRTIRELKQLGVPSSQIVAVVNRAPKNPFSRGEIGSALATLSQSDELSTVFVPDGDVEAALRDNTRLSKQITEPLLEAVVRKLDAEGGMVDAEPEAIRPGSLGFLDAAS